MPRVAVIRTEVQRNLKAVPFRPFALTMENGEQLVIGHPENIAFDPTSSEDEPGWDEFYLLTKKLRVFSTFGAVTSVALLDKAQVS